MFDGKRNLLVFFLIYYIARPFFIRRIFLRPYFPNTEVKPCSTEDGFPATEYENRRFVYLDVNT